MRFLPLVKNTSASLHPCTKYKSHCYSSLNCVNIIYMHINKPIVRWCGSIVPDFLLGSDEELSGLAIRSWFMYIGEAFLDFKYGLHSSWTNQNTTDKMGQRRCVWHQKNACLHATLPIKWSLTVQVRSQCPTLSATISAVALAPGERLTVSVWCVCVVRIWPWKWTEWMSTLFLKDYNHKNASNKHMHTFKKNPSGI